MFTLIHGHDARSVQISSPDGDVDVRVPSGAAGLPDAMLSRKDAHDALIKTKKKAIHFLAEVEADIEATAAKTLSR